MPRPHIEFIHAQDLPWQSNALPGALNDLDCKVLSSDAESGACSVIVKIPPGWSRQGIENWSAAQEFFVLDGAVDIGSQTYVGYDFMLVALAVVVGLGVWWGLNRTRFGKIVTAVIHSAEVASSMGIQVSRVYMLAFAVGIFLAALGGAFTAPMLSVQPGLSVGVIIISFAVVIIGGLGSIEGAAIGALTVGLARALAVHVWPVAELFSVYLVMALVLMFRPQGLFQRIQARKI